ncbi:MAG: hypothetical protein NVS9B10_18530 [Nevskia sp.]
MYLCVCKAVSDKRLRQAVEAGEVVSLRDLTRELGVGTGCGKCIPAAREALTAALSAQGAPRAVAAAGWTTVRPAMAVPELCAF